MEGDRNSENTVNVEYFFMISIHEISGQIYVWQRFFLYQRKMKITRILKYYLIINWRTWIHKSKRKQIWILITLWLCICIFKNSISLMENSISTLNFILFVIVYLLCNTIVCNVLYYIISTYILYVGTLYRKIKCTNFSN